MKSPMKSATISCPKLPRFTAVDLSAIRQAFAGAPACTLQQAWRAELEPDFAPGKVWLGWRDETLLILAELTDADIHTSATEPNQRLWELGDAFEVFLRPASQEAYSEIQVAPNNQRLQLRYASAAAVAQARQSNSVADALVHDLSFQSRTWVQSESRCWLALVEIPAAAVCDQPGPLPGSHWHFSFGRYDYTRGRSEPVISSSSALSQADFHRLAEWGTLHFI
jgi:hypothetical protein